MTGFEEAFEQFAKASMKDSQKTTDEQPEEEVPASPTHSGEVVAETKLDVGPTQVPFSISASVRLQTGSTFIVLEAQLLVFYCTNNYSWLIPK